jgi:prevent-host-death family protein
VRRNSTKILLGVIFGMREFPSSNLQRHLGEVLRTADAGAVVLTTHDTARAVLMPVAEYVRLCQAAGEPVPSFGERRARLHRPVPDPLGYDTSDFDAFARRISEDALSGRNKAAVANELAGIRSRLGLSGKTQ